MEDIKLNLADCQQIEGYPFLYILPDGKVYNSNSKRFISGKHYHDVKTDKYVNLVSLKRKMSIYMSSMRYTFEFNGKYSALNELLIENE